MKAEQYYLALPEGDLAGPAVPNRSHYVATDVADTVEWKLPALLEIFTAGDDVVEFTATKEADEEGARQTTDVVNYVFYQQNPGWQVLETWFKDTLIQKNGIIKVWWDDTPETVRETYRGLTDIQFAMMMMDNSVRPVEHSAYPDPIAMQAAIQQYQQAQRQAAIAQQQYAQAQQHSAMTGQPLNAPPPQAPQPPTPQSIPQLHDVAVVRTTSKGKVCIENVPPEEFLIARKSKRISDGFCAHRVRRTISDLRKKGYKNVDDVTSDDTASNDMSQEAIVRRSLEDAPFEIEDGNGDETMREVWLTECYLMVDFDGDGIAEWRKVVRAGNALLENVECDGPPFVSLCDIPLPHLFFGMSTAELAMPAQRLQTALWRGAIDNMHMLINGRTYAVEGQVNLDDLLSNRPGGVVRVKQAAAVGPLQQGMPDVAGITQLMESADAAKQDRTGVTKYTQGSDADTLNKTKGGLENITNRADARIKYTARRWAETGVKELFIQIQKLLAQYQDRSMTIKLRGEWVDVDPRAWKNQYNSVVNVGLGTGDKTLQVQHLTALGQAQAQAAQIGVATPQNIYHTLSKLPPLLGYKNADEFFTDPSKAPPQPPKPDPAMAKVQGDQQLEAAKLQGQQQADAAKINSQHQATMEELAMKERLETVRAQHDAQLELQKQQLLDARARDQFDRQMAWDREKFMLELAQKREAAELTAQVTAQQGNAQYNADLADTPRGA
jgi:hypothetical protein